MSHPHYDYGVGGDSKKIRVTTLAARLSTMASLVLSLVLLLTNDAKMGNGYVYTYSDFPSYRYLFYVTLVGIAYTVLQLPSALYFMLRKKHLINRPAFLKLDFYADKVLVFLLATAAGAAFGATADLNSRNIKWPGMQDFFNLAYVSAAFVVVGCVAAGISSVHSSLAMASLH